MANDFHAHRAREKGWRQTVYTPESYAAQFTSSAWTGQEVRYYRDDQLLGVGLFDELAGGLSAVIFHYRATWKADSPGVFNVLWLIERARLLGLEHVYLGYWVPGSASTSYKADYRPAEVLRGGAWVPLDEWVRREPDGREYDLGV